MIAPPWTPPTPGMVGINWQVLHLMKEKQG